MTTMAELWRPVFSAIIALFAILICEGLPKMLHSRIERYVGEELFGHFSKNLSTRIAVNAARFSLSTAAVLGLLFAIFVEFLKLGDFIPGAILVVFVIILVAFAPATIAWRNAKWIELDEAGYENSTGLTFRLLIGILSVFLIGCTYLSSKLEADHRAAERAETTRRELTAAAHPVVAQPSNSTSKGTIPTRVGDVK